MRLLLDTNVVIWLLLGDTDAVPARVQQAVEEIDNEVVVSAASIWEIAIKRSLDRLTIDANWLDAVFSLDLDHLPVTAEHAARVEALPWHHRDPFDRLLVAQASSERMTMVTADRLIGRYNVDVLW